MITPIEVQSRTFKGGMGYNKLDVDTFFNELSDSYETLYKENASLKEKIAGLEANLEHYRGIEKSLQKALVLAETTAEETIISAKKNATVIEQEAVLKAQTIVADAKVELERMKVQSSDLMKQYENYKAQYKALATSQLHLLDSEAYNFKTLDGDVISGLEKTAQENVDKLQAGPVNDGSYEPEKAEEPAKEEDFDETLSGSEDSEGLLKDISEIFDDGDTVSAAPENGSADQTE
ncbi:MAG: DivIVA domain-containing protein [Lachnospiraceae bacterium]|nr:DivIVA domain-containing protein [Lachnospiraceae bacterium]